MATRRRVYNHVAKDLGETLARQEYALRWHGVDDHTNAPFYENLGHGILPEGKHPTYPRQIDSFQTACDYLNELKKKFNKHIGVFPEVHARDGSADYTVEADEATDLATAIVLIQEMRSDMQQHGSDETQHNAEDPDMGLLGILDEPETEQDVINQALLFTTTYRNHLYVGTLRMDEDLSHI